MTLDPFGHSITDTTQMPKNWGERTGNRLHLKTKKIAIYNLLLFKRNSVYDSYKVQETERLIRSQKYVTAVRITHKLAGVASDSVDVTIRVLDSWSTIPRFSISSNQVSVGFKEKDFLDQVSNWNIVLQIVFMMAQTEMTLLTRFQISRILI
ncbi:hypothetical protein ACQ9BO_16705 [Flavobacterium sp. P21]|uniref:hypothetical protein n=1 Tax=Flavobacterium sp. P21 TaxID=3423948 RepID=UPI003D676B26